MFHATVPSVLQPRRFSIDEYHRVIDRGALKRGARTELLDGVIIDVAAAGPAHRVVVARLHQLLSSLVVPGLVLRAHEPLMLPDDSELSPDFAVVTSEAIAATVRHPSTAELVIEVADDRLELTRQHKVPAYAGAGVTELWLVNVPDRRVELFIKPEPALRRYRTTLVVDERGRLTSSALPYLTFEAAPLFA